MQSKIPNDEYKMIVVFLSAKYISRCKYTFTKYKTQCWLKSVCISTCTVIKIVRQTLKKFLWLSH